MTIGLICFFLALFMIIAINREADDNPNGASISVFQKLISRLDFLLTRNRFVSFISFSISSSKSTPKKIESIVWSRLCTVSFFAITYDLMMRCDRYPKSTLVITVLCIYLFFLQISMINTLLKPLFGVKRIGKGLTLDQKLSASKTVNIPAPKRSLLLALVNLFEIILSWGMIYRSIIPNISSAETANYFSIVTITTLGYGDINGGNNLLAQVAISFNLLIFVIFSVCHITTILGSITNKEL